MLDNTYCNHSMTVCFNENCVHYATDKIIKLARDADRLILFTEYYSPVQACPHWVSEDYLK